MYSINLQWKEFNINLAQVESELKALYPKIVGSSADYDFTLWSNEDFTDQEKEDINNYWDSLTSESVEATSYKTAAQIESERRTDIANKKASATTKLLALGLTQEEINAILGV